jgi:RNA polymerase sigma-70 factor (ECF subfamily)
MEADDADVIARSLQDPAAFAEIYTRHGRSVFSYARSRIGASLGEDIAAQVFLLAFERRATFDGSFGSARPWLLGITTNLIRHHVRDDRTHVAAFSKVKVDVQGGSADEAGMVEALDAERWRPALAAALTSLSDADRETFLLAAIGELTYAEIARVLSIPIGTVCSRINRARRLLREQLGAEVASPDRDDDPERRGPWTSST